MKGHYDAIIVVVPEWIKEVVQSYEQIEWVKALLPKLAIQIVRVQRYSLSNGLIMFQGRLVVEEDKELKTKIPKSLHYSPLGGHLGIKATYHKVRQLFFWPKHKKDVVEFVLACEMCQRCKHEHVPYPGSSGASMGKGLNGLCGGPT